MGNHPYVKNFPRKITMERIPTLHSNRRRSESSMTLEEELRTKKKKHRRWGNAVQSMQGMIIKSKY